ncbi:MAG: 4Fe-4S binding protein [Crenarchaeota archaeon]|nr:4Fe-4S binding protein [Thermoproteota archaeon]
MPVRKIVKINEDLCNGCGQCIPKCHEGALQLIDGKAKIVKEMYCDGLGACIGECPQGAITIVEREADEFDETAVKEHLAKIDVKKADAKSQAPQWPVQIKLMPIKAPFYDNADLLIVADCALVVCKDLREKLMPGRRLMMGFPKFDGVQEYAEKLGKILKENNVASITIAHMRVPCCSGLKWMVDKAIEASGKKIPVKQYIIEIGGEICE